MRRLSIRGPVVVAIALSNACSGDPSTGVPGSPRQPRQPSLEIVAGDRQSGEVGTPLAQPLVVELRDTLGVVAPRVVVRFYDERDGLVDSATTNAAGVASVVWTASRTAGAQRVGAIATVYPGRTNGSATALFTVTGLPGPIARVSVSLPRRQALPGTQLDTVVATVTDQFNNPIANAEVAWAVGSGSGSVRAVTTRTDQSGTARAIWTLGPTVGENTLTATVAGVTGRASAFVSEGLTASVVGAGLGHTCAVDPAGDAYCWGFGLFGQLGTGVADDRPHPTPQRVVGGLTFISVTTGAYHTCGLTTSGEAYCWGHGQIGPFNPGAGQQARPAPVPGQRRFTAIVAGVFHTCGLTIEGNVLCWGDNTYGQLGRSDDRSAYVYFGATGSLTPAPIAAESRSFVGLAAAALATCAVERSGEVYCWGGNQERELGTDTSDQCGIANYPYYSPPTYTVRCSTTPRSVNVRATVSLTASQASVCGLAADGEVVCWGNGAFPRVVTGARVSAVWSLGTAVCGSVVGGGVSCWSTRDPSGFPEVRPFGTSVSLVSLTTASGHACGVSSDAQRLVHCWGQNDRGQVGDGTTAYRYTPVRVLPPISPP